MSQNLSQFSTLPARSTTSSPQTININDGVFNSNMAGALALALPAIATVRGRFFWVRNQNNGSAITITPAGGETINGGANYVLAVGVTFTKPCCKIYAPTTGTDWLVLAQTPL